MNGTVSRISPDTTTDQRTGQSYYTIRVSMPPEEVAKLGDVKLIDPLRRRLAASDEFGLMAELGQNGVEHDAAEWIVFNAQDAKTSRRARHIRSRRRWLQRLRPLERNGQHECHAAARSLACRDVAAHGAGELLDRRQSKARTAETRRDADIRLRERFEQPLDRSSTRR